MTYFGSTEWYQRVSEGLVPLYSIVHKFGKNPTVPNSFEPISSLGTFWQPSTATTVRVKAGGNVNDTSAGTGARTIVVSGLDGSWDAIEETITLAGASASANTTASFFRIDRAYVDTAGAYLGQNTGDVIIEVSAGGTDIIQIDALCGQSTYGHAAIPRNRDVWMLGFFLTTDTTKTVDVQMLVAEQINTVAAPFGTQRALVNMQGIVDPIHFEIDGPNKLTASGRNSPMDVLFKAQVSAATSPITIDFELLLKDIS